LMAPILEAQRQREKLMAPILEAQRQREKLMAPILEAQRQREKMMAPILEAKARHRAMFAPLSTIQRQLDGLLAADQTVIVRDGLIPLAERTREAMIAHLEAVTAITDDADEGAPPIERLDADVSSDLTPIRLWADYAFVLVFTALLGWWLSEADRTGQVVVEMNRVEVGEHLVTFFGIAFAVRKAILSLDRA
jgi:hypothetical protein